MRMTVTVLVFKADYSTALYLSHCIVFFNVSDAFLAKIPKSPVRELLEMEPETAKFE